MTTPQPLSPAAQAVLDAVDKIGLDEASRLGVRQFFAEGCRIKRLEIAAATRTIAQQIINAAASRLLPAGYASPWRRLYQPP